MKNITSSIYSFENLIKENYLYVDKTEYIWQLVNHVGESYFLSRPRRFGKSLTVSTLKAVFEGKKELFKGLAIYDKPYDWKPCPIIHLDMNGRDFSTLESMEERFRQILREQAEINGVTLKETSSDTMFHELIKTLHDQKGDVVILLDEYDKPILNNISKENCSAFLDALKIFYSVIKEKNGMIRLAEIKRWYNGYRFEENATTVYNPVSLAKFFESGGKFNNYWFSTGTPTFLLDLIMKSKFELSLSLNKPVSGAFFDAFEVTDLDPMVMLFQTGYLTIDRAERRQIPFTSKAITEYYLHFPNMEVEESFNGSLLTYCTNVRKHDTQELMLNLVTAVGTGNVDGFMKLFQSIFAGIPYSIHVKDEHYYQTVFYVICDLLKLLVQAEVCTNDGRIDMMVAAGEWIYVIEFKLNKTADDAMQQIENKDYALKYRKEGHRIMLVGVNFDFNSGNISNWLKEEYCS